MSDGNSDYAHFDWADGSGWGIAGIGFFAGGGETVWRFGREGRISFGACSLGVCENVFVFGGYRAGA